MFNPHNTAANASGCGPAQGKFFGHGFGKFAHGPFGGGFRRPKYNVPVNIVDNTNAYEVYVYAVGFAKENIKISVEDNTLTIIGTRTVDETNLPNFSSQEFPIKTFERVIGLNDIVDKTAITARQTDGVLVVTLPKTEAAKTSAQEIKVD